MKKYIIVSIFSHGQGFKDDEQILLETDNYLEAVEKYHELEEEKKDELVYLELRQLEFIPTYKRIYI